MEGLTERGRAGLQRLVEARDAAWFSSRLCHSKVLCSSNHPPPPFLMEITIGSGWQAPGFFYFRPFRWDLKGKHKNTCKVYREWFLPDPLTEDRLFPKTRRAQHGLQFWGQTNRVWILAPNCTDGGPWVNYFLSLTLSFLTYEIGIIRPVVFRCGLGTSSISSTCELVSKNLDPTQTYWIRNSGDSIKHSALAGPPETLLHTKDWEPLNRASYCQTLSPKSTVRNLFFIVI